MAKDLRRRIVDPAAEQGVGGTPDWLDLATRAEIEVCSEDPAHPFEHALLPRYEAGWRAAAPGPQVLRIFFHEPTVLHRIYLHFVETELTRTQEFTLAWAEDRTAPPEILVRQRWSFSPAGPTHEIEDYRPSSGRTSLLQLEIVPDVSGGEARATLQQLRLA